MKILHKFVDTIPEEIDPNTLYISIKYNTAIHKCACGCGEEVVTPLSPVGWSLIYNGQSISLTPSIGNWSFKCRSHYWIKEDKINWAGSISKNSATKLAENESKVIKSHYTKLSIGDFLKNLFKN